MENKNKIRQLIFILECSDIPLSVIVHELLFRLSLLITLHYDGFEFFYLVFDYLHRIFLYYESHKILNQTPQKGTSRDGVNDAPDNEAKPFLSTKQAVFNNVRAAHEGQHPPVLHNQVRIA